MIIENKLESRTFGPFASSTGLFLFLGGVVFSYFNLSGLIMATIGAFIAFTSTRTIIDTEKKRIKHADYLFGIFPAGKWIDIRPGMKLGLRSSKKGYTGYVRGMQPVSIKYQDVRIFLCGTDNKQILPIKRFPTFKAAETELKDLGSLLGLPVI